MTLIINRCSFCLHKFNPPHEISEDLDGDISDAYCSYDCFRREIEGVVWRGMNSYASSKRSEMIHIMNQNQLLYPYFHSEPIDFDDLLEGEFHYERMMIYQAKDHLMQEHIEKKLKDQARHDKDYESARVEHLVWLARERETLRKEKEREEEMEERQREIAQKQFDKDYASGEKEHADYREAEAFQESLKPKPIPPHIRFEHTQILGQNIVNPATFYQ